MRRPLEGAGGAAAEAGREAGAVDYTWEQRMCLSVCGGILVGLLQCSFPENK